MQELIIRTPSPENKLPAPTEAGFWKHFAKVVSHAVALTIWVCTLVKLFVYDFDNFLLQTYFPAFSWLIAYKFIFVIVSVCILLISFNFRQLLLWLLFVSLYPILIFVWYVPHFVFRTNNWMLLVALLNSIFSFFQSIRYNFLCFTAGLISVVVILTVYNDAALYTSAGVLILLLSSTYFNRIVLAFKPFAVIKIYEKVFADVCSEFVTKQQKLDDSITSLAVIEMNPTQLTTFRSHFELSLLVNRICLFAAKILREYKTSGLTYLSGALTTVLLFITTVLVFSFINFAVFKLDSGAFEFNSTPTLFTFLHYSFENMVLSPIRDLVAVSTMSYDVNMMQKLFSILLIPIFVSQIIVIQKQRFTEELDAVIRRIESASHAMESFIFNEYRVSTIEEALAEIEGFKGSLVRILLFLTERLKY